MKLLQMIVAVLTVLLFLSRQNVLAGVCRGKTRSLSYCGSFSRPAPHSALDTCARGSRGVLSAHLALPKHKKDPKIRVDNEDIDYPVE